MKKHTKSIAALGACALALGAAGFGFSRWSSDLNLSGNVSAKNTWDMSIVAATVSNTSAGSSVNAEKHETAATTEVVVYDIYADYCTDFNPSWKEYRVHIDDLHPRTVTMTLEELQAYNYRCFIPGSIMVGYSNYESGLKGSSIQYMMNMSELAGELGFKNGYLYAENEDDSHDGEWIGTAIGEHLASPNKNPWGIQIMYDDVLNTLTNAAPIVDYPAAIAEDGQSAVFGDVNLGLPGAWAEYSVTVANNGTVNANMKDWSIALDTDSELLSLAAPDLSGDLILAPGETCTFTFVAQVEDTENPVLDENGTISVTLSHEQDTVEPAPAPSHNHN